MSIRVVHGINEGYFEFANQTVAKVARSLKEVFNIPQNASSLLNGNEVSATQILNDGDNLEFVHTFGRKGGIQDLWSEDELLHVFGKDQMKLLVEAGMKLTQRPSLSSDEFIHWNRWLQDQSNAPTPSIPVRVDVDQYKPEFAAEIYKSYLHCAAKIIRSEGGVITSYDGDRIMAVFIDGAKNSNAARCALKINYAVTQIINPAIKNQYSGTDFQVRQIVGIDTSKLFVARTGIRGSNDLVWVGRSANYAAKLCSQSSYYASWITADVYNCLLDSSKYGSDGRDMWESFWWEDRRMTVYRSSWHWKV